MTRDVRLVVWFTMFMCACGGGTVSEQPDGSTGPGADKDGGGPGTDPGDDDDAGDDPVTPGEDAGPVTPEGCGDGERSDPEGCDDGNLTAGDGCDLTCTLEDGWNCPPSGGACVERCGDGLRVGTEACDDGNATTNDGCSDTCTLEAGWVCLEPGMPCEAALCGDGMLAGVEECDDLDETPGDGCSIACRVEPGWVCPAAAQDCVASECGDTIRTGAEACDDGNTESGDGCTAACDAVEPNHACPSAGGACYRTSVCGNGLLTSDEECDDRNEDSGDGCSAACELELGWVCPNVGAACRAAACGDGIVAGREECEDGNTNANDGCADCRVSEGYACEPTGGSPASECHETECGDGQREGSEPCDDGNTLLSDGCTPFCQVEPSCDNGPCHSECGDGIKLSNDDEECDDGNTRAGDGCSASCELEEGYACVDVQSALPSNFELPAIFRDFIHAVAGGSTRHPDFQAFSGSNATEGLVGTSLVNGKPSYTGRCQQGSANASDTDVCPYGAQTTSATNFNQWYGESTSVMRKLVTTVTMNKVSNSQAYQNETFGQQLFPLDDLGWVAAGKEAESNGHNFGFTSELRHYFEFKGGEKLTFAGDDDVWVFIGGKLALDLGGLHSKQSRTIVLDAATGNVKCYTNTAATTPCSTNATRSLGLVVGEVYEMALFHAERHTGESNFDLTLTGFVSSKTECVSVCGDGVATPDEVCDDGQQCDGGANDGESCSDGGDCPDGTCVSLNDGSYGHCKPQCDGFGPHCGDGALQSVEACDGGSEANVGGYDGCTQTCELGPFCGDGTVDGFYGEQCDMGVSNNDGSYGRCNADCSFAPRCGDGQVQEDEGEQCDDRVNRSAYGGCAPGCVLAPYCGDGKVDTSRGEECDEGTDGNGGEYGTCTAECKRGSRCGDGKLDPEREECDDGNLNSYDGCSPQCFAEVVL